MHWLALITAGLIEIFGVVNLKRLADKKRFALPIAVLLMGLSLGVLSYALQTIPMGTGYAIWTGIGTVGTVIAGIIFYQDKLTFWRIFFVLLIVISVVGLKLVENM